MSSEVSETAELEQMREDAALGRRVREMVEKGMPELMALTLTTYAQVLILNTLQFGEGTAGTFQFEGVLHNGKPVGDWRVRVERIDGKEEA